VVTAGVGGARCGGMRWGRKGEDSNNSDIAVSLINGRCFEVGDGTGKSAVLVMERSYADRVGSCVVCVCEWERRRTPGQAVR
jgi:hypothetical protein